MYKAVELELINIVSPSFIKLAAYFAIFLLFSFAVKEVSFTSISLITGLSSTNLAPP